MTPAGVNTFAAQTTTLPSVSVGHLLMQMVLAIAVVGGGIWLFGKFVAKRRGGGRVLGRSTGEGLVVRQRSSLGKDHYLAVVEWHGRELLVGVSGGQISLIAEQSDEDGDTEEVAAHLVSMPPAERRLGTALGSRPRFIDALRTATLRN